MTTGDKYKNLNSFGDGLRRQKEKSSQRRLDALENFKAKIIERFGEKSLMDHIITKPGSGRYTIECLKHSGLKTHVKSVVIQSDDDHFCRFCKTKTEKKKTPPVPWWKNIG